MGGIAGVIFLLIYFPSVAGFVVLSSIGIAILFVTYRNYKNGSFPVNYKYKIAVYRRRDNPIAFWFYMFVAVGFVILACVTAVLFLLHKFKGQR